MTTYNTYQEAKIANPECEIYRFNEGFTCDSNRFGFSLPACNPADYCMTKSDFLESGKLLVGGDLVFNNIAHLFVTDDSKTNYKKNETYHRIANVKKNTNVDWFVILAAELEDMQLSEIGHVNVEHYKKPRTKIEYVKCEDSIFDLRDEFNSLDLYIIDDNEEPALIGGEKILANQYVNGTIYRKLETPMTEREEFIDAAIECIDDYSSDDPNYFKQWFESMYDSGKFKLVN